jgi:hypothetical protein
VSVQRSFGIGKETTYGTPVTIAKWFEMISEGVERQPQVARVSGIRSHSTRYGRIVHHDIEGPIRCILAYNELGHLMRAFWGSSDVTGAGPYTHTIPASTGPAVHSSYTIQLERDPSPLGFRVQGAVFTGLAFALKNMEISEVVATILGQDEQSTAASNPTYLTELFVGPLDLSVTIDAGAALDCTGINLNLVKPCDRPWILANSGFTKIPEQNEAVSLTGDMTLLFDDTASYWTKFRTGATVNLQIVAAQSPGSMTINLNKTLLTGCSNPVEGRNRLMATVRFESFFNTLATENFQMVLINAESTLAI